LDSSHQNEFNQLVDLEFGRMSHALHEAHDLDFDGTYRTWVSLGLSELPGELNEEDRRILKSYYARLSNEMRVILEKAQLMNSELFSQSLLPLMGFGNQRLVQVVCYHDFHGEQKNKIEIHQASELSVDFGLVRFKPTLNTASVDILFGKIELQIRIKPMNKFTTTAIKINCSVKRPNVF